MKVHGGPYGLGGAGLGRRVWLLLPLLAVVGLLVALVGADRRAQHSMEGLTRDFAVQRRATEEVTNIRRDTRKTYVAALERWLASPEKRSAPERQVDAQVDALLHDTQALRAGLPISDDDRQLRVQLLDAVVAWSDVLAHAIRSEWDPSVHLRAYIDDVDRLATAILQVTAAAARRGESEVEVLGRRRRRLQTGIVMVVLASACSGWVGWFRSRARARVATAERAQQEQARLTASLERAVAERTDELRRQAADLTVANETLAQEMKARLQIEADLRQAQKLESVGRLASGVAHEINTPVQFVSDSLHFVRDAVKDLFGVVEKLCAVQRSVIEGAPSQEAATEAAEAEQAADLPYLEENLPKALGRALDGLDRVATIVRSMKEFAHPDQTAMTTADLNRGIESTLTIARNEYKYVAEVETDLGDLPLVTCHAGELNQAFLNIIVNAAHAIGDVVRGTETKGRIRIRTWREGGSALVTISDTGAGIPEAVRHRIFEPFFTTKEVGRGTGQGLHIARSVVVEKHHGELTFETETGRGTTFTFRLPIEPPREGAKAA